MHLGEARNIKVGRGMGCVWGVLRQVCVGCVEARNIKVGRGTGCVGCVEASVCGVC